MIRISEFSPSLATNKNPQAKCKVIINNNNAPECIKEFPTITPEIETNESNEVNESLLYKHLAITFSNILKTNNPKLIANIIDLSGKVILPVEDLVDTISIMLNVNRNLITISYEDPEVGCMGKVNPIKQITDIKVNGYDFRLGYNKQYNILNSTFSISLSKTIIF